VTVNGSLLELYVRALWLKFSRPMTGEVGGRRQTLM
jgi:hypothetical protein